MANFPAKRLRKNTVLKVRMRQFFFFFKFSLAVKAYLFSCIISNKVNRSVFMSTFIVSQYLLNKPPKFHIQQIILIIT